MKKQNEITIVLENLAGGGAERCLVNLMNYLAEKGWIINLILVKQEGAFLKQLSNRVRIHDLRARNLYFSIFPLIRYLKKNTPAVVLSSLDVMNLITLLAVRLARVDTKTIIQVVNFVSKQKRSPIKKMLEKILLTYLYPWANQIVILSKDAAIDLANYAHIPHEKIRTIYSPVITMEIKKKAKENPPHPWFQDPTIPIILAIGRLNAQKNFSRLLRVFRKIIDETEARLIILGEGEERELLNTEIRSLGLTADVDMPGFVDNPYAFLTNTSVFALSSDYEGLAGVLIEALACGAPIVSVDCESGPREVLNNGKYGFIVPMKNEELFAKQIIETIKGNKKQVPEAWLDQFTVEYSAQEYIRLFENINPQ